MCWNEYADTIGGNLLRENDTQNVPAKANVLGYRLRNDPEWLQFSKENHRTIQAKSQYHSSVYTCECSFARTFRASEMGLKHYEMIELSESI